MCKHKKKKKKKKKGGIMGTVEAFVCNLMDV
jgi:hypothetical protein